MSSYCPISLISIFSKVFERVIYNSLFNHFLSNNQLSFPPGDLCIAQLLSIIHERLTTFDNNHTVDVIGVFLDISKEINKVCHDGRIFKKKPYRVEGELLMLLKNLQNHEQRAVLNGQLFGWRKINSGVP